jgi:hypothetical protein
MENATGFGRVAAGCALLDSAGARGIQARATLPDGFALAGSPCLKRYAM